jgi:hypothetical protein
MMRRTTHHRRRIRRAALGSSAPILAAALVLTACSPSRPQPAKSHGSSASTRPASARTAQGSSANGGHGATGSSSAPVGSALAVSDSSGTKLDVTVEKVIDPASGANKYSKAAASKHFVGVKLRVQNTAAKTYENNANNETTIILSTGNTVFPGTTAEWHVS